ncbi:response regulator [Paenibacillus sp. TRM 82003]|uniref:response regulator n=1 Tax=unclassified Kineococcus TaxID=2621656 RepID=UPI001F59A27A|nr:response regulator [Kineococcus sp. TRM81007]MCI2238054.1 response regulator [Kineococcus sp. TRM81007]MCI3926069.1 response regulator [Paenibacillus sp. TRM 82003]
MKALVVDDSRAMRKIIAGALRKLGYETVEAADGAEALKVLQEGPLPELATVDWNMPVMDGLTFVTQVRAIREYRSLSIMMVTTEAEHGQIVRALAAGAHEYLIKPFTVEALEEKLALLGLLPEVTA